MFDIVLDLITQFTPLIVPIICLILVFNILSDLLFRG